ncbi:hypothetical protein [Candidatus Palauibacter sp.]|uniref:hypothetical protein n=1 Tax=Candidatus Palauibacter sp. TaxID=3101350 RepID=UPI003AF2B586
MSEGEKLSDFRSASGYVLLGEPGSGKSEAFKLERGHDENGVEVTARHFIRRSLDAHPEWRHGTLLIDGLDEVRAQGGDPREPLDALVCRLEQLGKPTFRLSCREDSWLGRNDFHELTSVVDRDELHLLRLDPLTVEDARRILAAAEVPDREGFLWKAVDSGLEVFLQNPLLLDIVIQAETSRSWPNGQLAAFEWACEKLARETNQGHLDARDGNPFASDEVVLAAGRLCAILLLTGTSGWSRRGPGDDDFPALSEAGRDQPLLKFALDSKLFTGTDEAGRQPRHRRIAEFLAGKYLDRAIRENHVPARRVLAWMRGIDGVLMPDLRGISVWLAARNPDTRRPLIESDPVGVAFLGDAGGFDRHDTALLLSGVEEQLAHHGESASSASLAALMAGPARDLLWDMLRTPDPSDARQGLVGLLLRGLAATPRSGYTAPTAREILPAVLRDDSWRSTVRQRALVALIHLLEQQADGPPILLGLLREIDEGRIPEDEDGELRGELLTRLYPQHIAAGEVWDCAMRMWHVDDRAPDDPAVSPVPRGKGEAFWTEHLVKESAPEGIRSLLDGLVARAEELIFLLAQNDVESVVFRLLARGLELFGEGMEVSELYEWFDVVEAHYERAELVPAHCRNVGVSSRHVQEQGRIYRWLREHREIQHGLILEALKRHASLPRERMLDHPIGVKFLGDEAPAGFRGWCLEKAVALARTNPPAAIELACWAVTRRREWGPPVSDDAVVAAVQGTPLLREWHEKRLTAEAKYAAHEAELRESPRYREVRERRQAYLASIREELAAVEAGQTPSGRFHDLGRVYWNGVEQGGPDQPCEELGRHLASSRASDQDLPEAVIRGFRGLAGRTDLPGLDRIIRFHEQGLTSFFSLPFLAGLAEDERAGEDPLQRLNEGALRRTLGFYLLSGLPTRRHPTPRLFSRSEDTRPGWFLQALETHPQTVADAFAAVHGARVRAKEFPDQHLYDLATKAEYELVAPLAVPRMFSPFASSCTEPQIEALRPILWAALRFMPRDELGRLVRRRLRRKGMDVAQQAHWLGAGLFVEPKACFPRLFDFVSKGRKTRRIRHLVDFLVQDRQPLPNQDWSTADLLALIQVVGRELRLPWDDLRDSSAQFMASGSFATELKVDPLMNAWVKTLAGRVEEEAIAALSDLADDPTLKNWHAMLLRARDEQAAKHRISTYEAPTVRQIRDALCGGPPTSAADLSALVSDKLVKLATRIRDGNTDTWQQYWHTDPDDPRGREVDKPKPEDPCRDALLSDLQLLLDAHDVDAQPEGHHAEDNRSDIIAVHGVHAVVVEVKKTDSRDLWSAIEEQLIARYTRDPRSGGYGIYLVFWFGADHLKRAPPAGTRPESSDELRDRLIDRIPREQRRTITVLVVDVSAPPGRRKVVA